MIQLAINSTFLDTDAKLSISIKEAFAFDEFLSIPGEHSWKFSLPKTPTNRRAFGFADVPEIVWQPATSYPCSIYIDGRIFKSGKLFIEQASNTQFDVYFVGTMGALKQVLNGIKMHELTNLPVVTGINNMFTYAKDAATATNQPFVFCEVYMPNGDLPLNFLNRVDYTRTSTGNWEGFEETGVNLLTPFLYLREFWQTLALEYGITYNSTFLQDAEINSLIIFNNKPLNIPSTAGEFQNLFPKRIDARNHVPDETVEDFLVEFAKLFNLFIYYDDNTKVLSIIPRQNMLNLPRVIYNNKLVSYNTVFKDAKTYSYRFNLNEAELNASEDWQGTLAGVNGPVGSDVIECKMSTLPMWDLNTNGIFHLPLCTQRVGESVGMRLLFYRGLQNTNAAAPSWGPIPLAASDTRYTTGFNLALTWQDNEGLYQTWYKNWEESAGAARTLKLILLLSEADLINFSPDKVYVIDGYKCLIKNLEYELGTREVLAEAEVLKIS